jgi:hypothetical protein
VIHVCLCAPGALRSDARRAESRAISRAHARAGSAGAIRFPFRFPLPISLLAVFGDCHAQAAAQSEGEDELDQKARADFAEQRCNELRRRSTVAKEQALAATDAATLGDADADADATRRRSESATARMAGFTVKRRISGAVGNEANARLVPATRRASIADESVAASGMRLAR